MQSHPVAVDLTRLWTAVSGQFSLGRGSIHGPSHWRRVERFGLRVGNAAGADLLVVRLFAVFHDSRRENEAIDPGHGIRGAELALAMRGELFELEDDRLQKLVYACRHHTDAHLSMDPTIGACWDGDRLDLWRIGVDPCENYLSTREARRPETIRWAEKER